MNSKNFQFLLQAYETDCNEFRSIAYEESVKLILSHLKYSNRPNEIIYEIALHLDQNSFTGSHSYYFNSVFREQPLKFESVLKLMLKDPTDFYPEFYNNSHLTEEMIMKLRKQREYDIEIVKKKYFNIELDPIYFPHNCKEEIVELYLNDDEVDGTIRIISLKSLLFDLFINKKDHKTGKEFTKEFHQRIFNSYPYEYLMYLNFAEALKS